MELTPNETILWIDAKLRADPALAQKTSELLCKLLTLPEGELNPPELVDLVGLRYDEESKMYEVLE